MATTKIWKVENRLDHVMDYTTNEEKTKNEYLENGVDVYDSIRQVMMYATNADKTEKQFYTTGINCDVDSAVEEMRNAKDFWHKTDGILAFHAEQSFKENEVTPEIAHEIGTKLAEKLWGDKYQVVICTHINKQNVHNHIIINSVSFVDGNKYHNSNAEIAFMKEASDRLCLNYGLSIVNTPKADKEKEFRQKNIDYFNRRDEKMQKIKNKIES